MANSIFFILLALLVNLGSSVARVLLSNNDQMLFKYHDGPLLTGRVTVNLVWYGQFKPSQKAIVADFISSLQSSPSDHQIQPSVATWWKTTQNYYKLVKNKGYASPAVILALGKQISDKNCSLGKTLSNQQVQLLASNGGDRPNSINVVLTSSDVSVDGFCSSRCGTHGALPKKPKLPYIWVGNSETQCPGQCAWPFHQPIYGPQTPPLVAPNNDVGMDGLIISLSGLLAGTVTNPFGNGFFQGPPDAPLEAASACPGIYGKGAYPGYAGELRKDSATGGSYNAQGVNHRRYLLPALYDPSTKSCFTLA